MSTTPTVDAPIDGCRPTDATPVTIDADSLTSTAPDDLRDLKYELASRDLVPARLTVHACFDEDCSFATQSEADRVREYVRAAAFLGVSTLTVSFDDVSNPDKVRPALAACEERARREGVSLLLDGPLTLDS